MSTTYSQYGEDITIAEIFTNAQQHTGRLLDIGAWDSVEKSNSRLLIEKGWSAVLIEPSPKPLRNLIATYGPVFSRKPGQDIIVVGAAVGLTGGMVRMAITDDAVSTSSAEVEKLWQEKGGYVGHAYFPAITLQDIFNRFGGDYDFVNIDAEGLSIPLAIEYLKTEAFPRVICCEHDNRSVELMQVAAKRGYSAREMNGTNIILEHRRA
jgi:FkbM family methyltransferase